MSRSGCGEQSPCVVGKISHIWYLKALQHAGCRPACGCLLLQLRIYWQVFLCFFFFIFSFFIFFSSPQQVRTGDLGGYATSDEFTRAVIANLAVWVCNSLCLQICRLLRRMYAHRPPAELAVHTVHFTSSSRYVSYLNVQSADFQCLACKMCSLIYLFP